MDRKIGKKIIAACGIIVFAISCMFFVYCEGDKKSSPYVEQQSFVEKSQTNKSEELIEDKSLEELIKDDNTVIWTVPGLGTLDQSNVDYLNELLEKDGYSIKLAVRTIDASTEADTFNRTIKELLKEGKTDIVYTGMLVEEKQIALPLIESGYLENLNSYLKTTEGKQLKKAFAETEWEATCISGNNYVIPAQDLDTQFYVAFNKKYIKKQDAESFSGDWSDLLNYVSVGMGDNNSFVPIIWTMGTTYALEAQGYQEIYGLLGDIKTGEISNPFELPEYYDLLKFLHTAWENGYLGSDYSFEYGSMGDSANDALVEGNYAILVGYSESFIAEHREQLTVVPVKNCKYRLDNDGCTGIASKSKKKEKAFKLLSLIYTNEKYANALAYGEEGKDYEVEGEYISSYSEEDNMELLSFVYGIYDMLLPKKGSEFAPNVKENRRAYLESDYCQKSIFLKFHLDVADWNEEILKAQNITAYEHVICTSKIFEEEYKKAEKEVSKETERLEQYIQKEFDRWYQSSEK